MMPETGTQEQAHPMPGWVSLIPIPGGHEEGSSSETYITIGTFTIPSVLASNPGIQAALVIEVGKLPESVHDAMIPFPQGAKVYYQDDRGVPIGDYVFIRTDSVIAWTN